MWQWCVQELVSRAEHQLVIAHTAHAERQKFVQQRNDFVQAQRHAKGEKR